MMHSHWHHPLSHGTTNDFNDIEVAGKKDRLAEIDRWNVGELTKLLDMMDGYDEGGGGTLLDNSVTFTRTSSSTARDTTGDLPFMIIDGAGYFKQGPA
jgi:hypothetical protein